MDPAAAANDTAARDTAESDRLAGVSRRLSAVESKLAAETTSENQGGGFPWAVLLAPLAIVAALVAAFIVHKRKPKESTP